MSQKKHVGHFILFAYGYYDTVILVQVLRVLLYCTVAEEGFPLDFPKVFNVSHLRALGGLPRGVAAADMRITMRRPSGGWRNIAI